MLISQAVRANARTACVFVLTPTAEGAYSRMFAPEHGIAENPATVRTAESACEAILGLEPGSSCGCRSRPRSSAGPRLDAEFGEGLLIGWVESQKGKFRLMILRNAPLGDCQSERLRARVNCALACAGNSHAIKGVASLDRRVKMFDDQA